MLGFFKNIKEKVQETIIINNTPVSGEVRIIKEYLDIIDRINVLNDKESDSNKISDKDAKKAIKKILNSSRNLLLNDLNTLALAYDLVPEKSNVISNVLKPNNKFGQEIIENKVLTPVKSNYKIIKMPFVDEEEVLSISKKIKEKNVAYSDYIELLDKYRLNDAITRIIQLHRYHTSLNESKLKSKIKELVINKKLIKQYFDILDRYLGNVLPDEGKTYIINKYILEDNFNKIESGLIFTSLPAFRGNLLKDVIFIRKNIYNAIAKDEFLLDLYLTHNNTNLVVIDEEIK